jgi:hypothetical protein
MGSSKMEGGKRMPPGRIGFYLGLGSLAIALLIRFIGFG